MPDDLAGLTQDFEASLRARAAARWSMLYVVCCVCGLGENLGLEEEGRMDARVGELEVDHFLAKGCLGQIYRVAEHPYDTAVGPPRRPVPTPAPGPGMPVSR